LVHSFPQFAAKTFPPYPNNVSTLLFKLEMSSHTCYHELLEKETTEFIPPQLWPPNSADAVDYSVWGILQEKVYKTRSTDLNELEERLRTAWTKLDHVTTTDICQWRRVSGGGLVNRGVREWRSCSHSLPTVIESFPFPFPPIHSPTLHFNSNFLHHLYSHFHPFPLPFPAATI